MKKITFIFCVLLSLSLAAQEFQEQYQRAKISYNTQDALQHLESIGIPVSHGTHKPGHFVISDFSVSEINKAKAAGYQVEILIEDSKEYFLQANREGRAQAQNPTCANQSITYQTPANFTLGSMGGYLTYQEMLDQLDLMKTLYPNLITTKTGIGNFLTEGQPDNSTTPSIGGNAIQWVKISDNPNSSAEGEEQILYTAIHHAREPASLSQLIFYMWYLLENYDTDDEVKNIVDNTELYFVPVINVDGYLYNEKTDPNGGGFWRKNRKNGHGVDNNRNYDYYINGNPADGVWAGDGTSPDPNSQVYHGDAPFSEVENQAIKWFAEQHDFVMAFNNHTSGNLLLYPYGYADNVPTPEDNLFQSISEELVSQNGFNNIISSGLYPAAGDSDDFLYGTIGTHNKIYAFTPEIGPEFWPPSNQIESICKSMMYLNITAAQMVNNYASIKDNSSAYIESISNLSAEFTLKRLGLTGDGTFTVSLEAVSSNISATGNAQTFTTMPLLSEESGSINYTLSGTIAPGDEIVYDLVVDNGTYTIRKRIQKTIGTLESVFEDSGNSTSDNFNNNGWATTTNEFVSPSSSITDSPNGNYPNNSNKTITLLDEIDLTSVTLGANVTFFAKWDIEDNWDYVQFEVSTNGGKTWTPQCGNYTNAGSTNNGQPTDEPLYDGTQLDWIQEEIDLSDYLGESILLRFQFRSDGEVREDGFYFDDLTVNIIDDVLSTPSNTPDNFSLHPNPVSSNLTITTPNNLYDVSIYNIQGQLLSTYTNLSGTQQLDYSKYSNGIYFMHIATSDQNFTYKIIKE